MDTQLLRLVPDAVKGPDGKWTGTDNSPIIKAMLEDVGVPTQLSSQPSELQLDFYRSSGERLGYFKVNDPDLVFTDATGAQFKMADLLADQSRMEWMLKNWGGLRGMPADRSEIDKWMEHDP